MTEIPNFDAPEIPTLCPTFHHVNLRTNRLDEMIEWYSTVIGSYKNYYRQDIAFITNDAANHRIALAARTEYEERRPLQIGMHHTAFEFRSLDELLLTWQRLQREDILPSFCLNHGMTTSFYYRDPDGNHVELQCDNFDNWPRSSAWMRDDPRFLEDPVGPHVDPAKMIEARKSGASAWEIHVMSYERKLEPDVIPDII